MSGVLRVTGFGLAALALAGLAAAPAARAGGRIDRPGVYVLGGWLQYGLVEGKSRYGYDFDNGMGYNLHFRYNASPKVALVLNFDNQGYGTRAEPDSTQPDKFTFTAVHGGVRWFNIPAGDVLRYAEVTVGFYRPELRYKNTQASSISEGDVAYPPENVLVHVGVGAEIFFTQVLAVEMGLHGYGLAGKGLLRTETPAGDERAFTFGGQVTLGIDYFVTR